MLTAAAQAMRTMIRPIIRAPVLVAIIFLGCGVMGLGAMLTPATAAGLPASRSSHIVVIVMENKESTDVLGNPAAPYLKGLVRRYGLATQSYGVAHPSLPNYLALTSGSTQGITSDCTSCSVNAPNIVDQLTSAGISWKAYLEDYPAPCFAGATSGNYAKRHNPFIYYTDIAQNPSRCSHLVGFGALSADVRSGQLPAYSWITPNVCNDTHACSVAVGDRFLAATVPSLLSALGPHGFLVLTWDEGASNAGCCGIARGGHVATVVAGPDVIAGSRESSRVDHYGVLATIERALRLPLLGQAGNPLNGRLDPLISPRPVAHPTHAQWIWLHAVYIPAHFARGLRARVWTRLTSNPNTALALVHRDGSTGIR